MGKADSSKVDTKVRIKRILYKIFLVIGCFTVALSALMFTGVLLPFLPVISTLGSMFLTGNVHFFLLLSLITTALLYVAIRRGAGSKVKKFFLVGGYAVVGCLVVIATQMSVAYKNDVTPNPFAGFVSSSAKPDETVQYATDSGKPLTIDVYRPANGKTNAPVAMYVHGGGWVAGDSTSQAANLRWLSKQGYLALAVNFTLATKDHATWNTAIPQVQCSFGWVKTNAAKYGGDPSRFAVFGESSGGQIALTSTYAAAAGKATSSCGGEMPKVSAVVAYAAPVDMKSFYNNSDAMMGKVAKDFASAYLGGTPEQHPDRTTAVEPASYLTKDAPSTLIFVNQRDHLIPQEATKRFVSAAKDSGVEVKTVESMWQDHASAVQYNSLPNQVFKQLMLNHFKASGV
jgi:acetyl esterase/lipase